VTLPVVGSISGLRGIVSFPSFSSLDDLRRIFPLGLTLAIVASLETLLSVEAVDKLDPLRRISSTNRELVAQGVGNLASGCMGGLPITAVIVRSSANVYAGARTRVSGFSHGILLLLAITIAPSLLNRIPLASLAAVLIVVGVKLASPILVRTMWREGLEQFLPFAGTALAVMFSDLLTGVLIGLCIGLFFVLRRHRARSISVISSDDGSMIRFNKDLSFIHRAELKNILINIPEKSSILIDATGAFYVDNDIRELLRDFADLAPLRHIALEFRGIKFS
jgi:MFS superfamily sulfate permease-like transporter